MFVLQHPVLQYFKPVVPYFVPEMLQEGLRIYHGRASCFLYLSGCMQVLLKKSCLHSGQHSKQSEVPFTLSFTTVSTRLQGVCKHRIRGKSNIETLS